MKLFIHILLSLVVIAAFSAPASASVSQIDFAGVSGTGNYHGLDALTDGYIPSEWSSWKKNTTWSRGSWLASGPSDRDVDVYTFDLGKLFTVQDITLSVDSNDTYQVQYSTNGNDWNNLFTVNWYNGLVAFGMDTFSTAEGDSEYLRAIDFEPVQAKYLRLFWTAGDGKYAVGEFQASGTAATPIPGAVWLLGTGLAGLVVVRRKFA